MPVTHEPFSVQPRFPEPASKIKREAAVINELCSRRWIRGQIEFCGAAELTLAACLLLLTPHPPAVVTCTRSVSTLDCPSIEKINAPHLRKVLGAWQLVFAQPHTRMSETPGNWLSASLRGPKRRICPKQADEFPESSAPRTTPDLRSTPFSF